MKESETVKEASRTYVEGDLIRSKQLAFQAIETGTEILGKLEKQEEYLNQVDKVCIRNSCCLLLICLLLKLGVRNNRRK